MVWIIKRRHQPWHHIHLWVSWIKATQPRLRPTMNKFLPVIQLFHDRSWGRSIVGHCRSCQTSFWNHINSNTPRGHHFQAFCTVLCVVRLTSKHVRGCNWFHKLGVNSDKWIASFSWSGLYCLNCQNPSDILMLLRRIIPALGSSPRHISVTAITYRELVLSMSLHNPTTTLVYQIL